MQSRFHMHKARLETLVDGIFAIAMTILVLEIKVPELTDGRSSSELLAALGHHGYVIGAYVLSFGMLANFWVWHHRLVERIREIDLPILLCTIVFLAVICSFPFATALLGRYPLNLAALLVYVPLVGLIVVVQTLLFWLAIRRGLLVTSVTAQEATRTHQRNLMGCAIFFLTCIPTALRVHWSAVIGTTLVGLVSLWAALRKTQ